MPGGKPDFWITQGRTTTPRVHLAFGAADRATVRAFYGAFVLDPDGHNLEAVCHRPE